MSAGDARPDGSLEILPVGGLPEVRAGDDVAGLIAAASSLRDGDVVVVAQKIVSKAEGATADVPAGADVAALRRKLARRSAVQIVVDTPGVLVVRTATGLVCANAGIDASNTAEGTLLLLPADPDASARRLRDGLRRHAGVDVGVVVADTFGRPWRQGQTDVAIGVAGFAAIRDERGSPDRAGRRLEVTETAVADEVAAAADLVRRKADGVPAVVVRGLSVPPDDGRGAAALVRGADGDLFPRGKGMLAAAVTAGWSDEPVGPVTPGDLERVLTVVRPPVRAEAAADGKASTIRLSGGEPSDRGVAAGLLVAALVDAGWAARAEPGPDGPSVRAGRPPRPR